MSAAMSANSRWRRREALAALAGGAALAAGAGRAAAGGAGPWRIGLFTRPWAKWDYRFTFDAIAETGCRDLGLMTVAPPRRLVISCDTTPEEADEVAREARARGLSVVAVYGGDGWARPDAGEGAQGLRRLIDRCSAVGSPTLMLGGTGKSDMVEAYLRTVAICAPYAAERRMEIVIKPHGGLNATAPQLADWVRRVGQPNFRVWYDPANILYYSDSALDPVEQAGVLDGFVAGMCVKDFLPPKDVAVTPGDGRVDFAAVLRRLVRGGFARGPLVIECLKPGEPAELLAEAKRALEFVRRLTAAL